MAEHVIWAIKCENRSIRLGCADAQVSSRKGKERKGKQRKGKEREGLKRDNVLYVTPLWSLFQ